MRLVYIGVLIILSIYQAYIIYAYILAIRCAGSLCGLDLAIASLPFEYVAVALGYAVNGICSLFAKGYAIGMHEARLVSGSILCLSIIAYSVRKLRASR